MSQELFTSQFTCQLQNVKFNGSQSDSLKERSKEWLWENIDRIIEETRTPDTQACKDALVAARDALRDMVEESKIEFPNVFQLDSQTEGTNIFDSLKAIAQIDKLLGETK